MTAVIEREKIAAEPQTIDTASLHRLRVEDYDKMIEHGIFDEDDRIELWNGVLVKMSPKGVKHRNATYLASTLLQEKFGRSVIVQSQDPIRLSDFSEPEPDIVLAEAPLARYAVRHPAPEDILLVLEIADTTILQDRKKAQYYAENGISQYLILNLQTNEIEEYIEPGAEGYRRKQTYTADESFRLAAFPEIEIKVSELLPPEQSE